MYCNELVLSLTRMESMVFDKQERKKNRLVKYFVLHTALMYRTTGKNYLLILRLAF